MAARALLHRLSLHDRTVDLVPTDAAHLRKHAFLDGRSDFATGPAFRKTLDDFATGVPGSLAHPRYIFHVSFCGSTLLARILDIPGRALALREPNCLADLANQRAAADKAASLPPGWTGAVDLVERHLAQPWASGEPVIVKPSNWANNLLPDLCPRQSRVSAVFLTIDRRAFLEAVFRGGQDRLAYTARSAVHLSSAGARNAELVAAALARETDQLGKLAALAVVAHRMQCDMFDRAIDRLGAADGNRLTLAELTADPMATAQKAARALEIDIPSSDLEKSICHWTGVHAKQPDATFSAERQRGADRATLHQHGEAIDAALDWADTAFPS